MDFFFLPGCYAQVGNNNPQTGPLQLVYGSWDRKRPPCMVRFNQRLYVVHLEAKVPYIYKNNEFLQKTQAWYFQKTAVYAFTSGLGTFGVLVSPRECSSSTLDHFGILQFCMEVHVLKFCKNCLKAHILYLP